MICSITLKERYILSVVKLYESLIYCVPRDSLAISDRAKEPISFFRNLILNRVKISTLTKNIGSFIQAAHQATQINSRKVLYPFTDLKTFKPFA